MRKGEYVAWYVVLLCSSWLISRGIGAALGDTASGWAIILLFFAVVYGWNDRWHRRAAWQCGTALRHGVVLLVGMRMRRSWRQDFSILDEPIEIDGITTWMGAGLTADDRAQLPVLHEALDMLEALVPSRRRRIDRLGLQLAVMPIGTAAGAFIQPISLIALNPAVLHEGPGVVAGLLVHELNHARVGAFGTLNPIHERSLERLARRDQYAFALRLRSVDYAAACRVREFALADFTVGMWQKMTEQVQHEQSRSRNA